MPKRRSLTGALAAVYLLLLVYASLYPFEHWRWPAGAELHELAVLSWPPWRDRFDEWANILGYAPYGALVFLVLAGRGAPPSLAFLVAVLAASMLSYGLEFFQHFIPGRFPSRRDWVNNTVGGAAGAACAWFVQGSGLADAGERWRERWFIEGSTLARLLLALWPVGLLFPAPVPLGLGHLGPELRSLLQAAVASTPFEASLAPILAAASAPHAMLNPWREALAVGLGLAAPCLLASVVTQPGWRRILLAPAALLVGVIVMSLSTALNFGPEHAWTWATRATLQALSMSAALCLLVCAAEPRFSAALALVVMTALVVVVAEAPQDPYYAASLLGWEQGRFIRFHGLAQWVGLLWPYAGIGWLVAWLARRR